MCELLVLSYLLLHRYQSRSLRAPKTSRLKLTVQRQFPELCLGLKPDV
jgi:hypothetical protein